MFQQTPLRRVLFASTRIKAITAWFVALTAIAASLLGGFILQSQQALAATNSTLNFQARLENSSGSIVPDGTYNVEFKLYNVSSAGSALWTETWYDSNGATAGNDNRITVQNGYLTANLGSQTAFPSTINWDQDLWVTMNIGGVTQTATPTWDGEMNPRLKLTGVPYAFRAGALATFNSGNGFTSTLSLLQPTVGNQVFQIPDQAAAGTYSLCVQGSVSGCTPGAGSSNYIQNQIASQQPTSNFWISGTGRADTAILTPRIDTAAAGAFTIGNTNATSITLGKTSGVTNIATTVNGTAIFKPNTDSPTAFQVQNAGNTSLLTVATDTNKVITTNLESSVAGTLTTNVKATTVDAVGNVGQPSSLKIGTDGFARISYFDTTNSYLKFLQCTNADCTTNNTTTVDNSGSAGMNSSLAIGADTFARISYYDSVATNLKMIQCTNADCTTKTTTTVDSTTGVGSDSSIAIGSDTFARISYLDSTNGDLKFIQCTNAACTTKNTTTADSTGSVGYTSSIAIGSDTFARISYLDSTNGSLKFVQCTNAACTTKNTTTVASGGGIDSGGSLAIGSDTFARISYYDGAFDDLRLIQCTNAACTTKNTTSVASAVGGFTDTAMALGSDTFARISYFDNLNFNLKMIQCTNATCSTKNTTTVDGIGIVGMNSSLALGSDGFARISYYDAFQQNLKYARLTSATGAEVIAGSIIGSSSAFGKLYVKGLDLQGGLAIDNAQRTTPAISISGGGSYLRAIDGGSGIIDLSSSGLILQTSTGASSMVLSDKGLTVSSSSPDNKDGALQVVNATTAPAIRISNSGGGQYFNADNLMTVGSNGDIYTAGTLSASTLVLTPGIDVGVPQALSIGSTTATSIDLGQVVTVAAGKSITMIGGITSTRPASPTAGMLYYDQTTNQLLTYTGTKWTADREANSKIVAASNSSQAAKDAADYVADGNTVSANDGDQVQIQAALNAVETAGVGGKVYLMEGTYVADATIQIPDNVTFAGAGRGTIIELADLDATDNLIENKNTTNGVGVVIQDMLLDGRRDLNTAGTQNGIAFTNLGSGTGSTAVHGAKVSNVYIKRFRISALALSTVANSIFTNNIFQDSNDPINGMVEASTLSYSTFSNNQFEGGRTAIHLISTSTYNTITGNTFQSLIGTGVWIAGTTSSYNTINGNVISGANNGIDNAGPNNVISNNVVESATTAGILLNGSTATNNVVSNNRIANSGNTTLNNGIWLISSPTSNTVTGNAISDSSATTTNNAIVVTGAGNYFADNTLGGGALSDPTGVALYGSQVDGNGIMLTRSTGGTTLQSAAGVDMFAAIANTATNLLTNPSFDSTTTGWSVAGTGTSAARTTTAANVHSGTGSYAVSTASSGTTTVTIAAAGITGGTQPAAQYTLSFYAKGSAAITLGANATFNGGGASCALSSTAVTTTGWQRYSCTVTPGVATTSISFTTTTLSQTLYIDSVQLQSGAAATVYNVGTMYLQGIVGSPVLLQAASNSPNAFQVNNAAGNSILTVDTTNGQIGIGKASSLTASMVLYNSTNANTVTVNAGVTSTSYALTLPLALGASGDCLKDTTGAGVLGFGSCGAGSSTLQAAYTASTGGATAEIVLDATRNGLTVRNAASDTISGNLLEIQNNAGTATFLGASNAAITMQDASGNSALVFDSTSSVLKIYENVTSPTNFASISYASGAAIFSASSGITQVGSGSGNIALNLSNAADVLTGSKAFTAAAGYSATDFSFSRNIVGGANALQGSVLKIEDLSTIAGGSSSPNLLYINQNNASATGNLILVQTGGSTNRLSLSTAGDLDISGVYKKGGTSGSTATCSGGNVLTNQVIQGGIVTGGTCGAAGSNSNMQNIYDNSVTTASILMTDAKNFVITAADTATDPSVLVNLQCVTSCSTNGRFAVQKAGSDIFLVNPDGSIRIGDASNNMTFDLTTKEPALNGTARHSRKITLSPEYAGASMTGDGTNNVGTMTSDNMAVSPFRNFYKWTTTQGTAQDYDIWVRIPMPTDYSAMPTGQTICMDTYASATTANGIALTLYGTNNSSVALTDGDLTPSATTTWQNQCTSSITGGTYAADGVMTLQIKLNAPATTGDIRISNITFNYLSKW